MNVWKVRHEGSPVASSDLTFVQVMQGLMDGRFAPTDEVRGPNDANWIVLEEHPAFADACGEIEPPPIKHDEDESRLDMNALIDVSLVLLVFFILTTSYLNLQKIIEAAEVSSSKGGIKVVEQKVVEETMILCEVKYENDKSIISIQGKEVPQDGVVAELKNLAGAAKKRILALKHDAKVPHGVIVSIQDAAKSAQMEKVVLVVP
jgi:biopolymer transport protein ExbD